MATNKIIIDSGSTKADWVIITADDQREFTSGGMNPLFISVDQIKLMIISNTDSIDRSKIHEIYFYGAGCSDESGKKIINEAFAFTFINAKIKIETDLMAAAYSTCGREEGIVSIIGTGSNSVYYDGHKIVPNNYGLGFILGDEGAGTYLGKKIITSFLYEQMPADLMNKFREQYKLNRQLVINYTYSQPSPNTWLATFAQFMVVNIDHQWVRENVLNGFNEFITLYVLPLQKINPVSVHFVGSIAFYFSSYLKEVIANHSLALGKILKRPMEGLIVFHEKK